MQTPICAISEICGSVAVLQDASGSHVAGQQAEDSSESLVIAHVYAHNAELDEGTRCISNENNKQGENFGVLAGSINHSANREVLITDEIFMPGEGQSLGD
jgi:hypothetical protein